jgi:hypothetical protein
MTSTFNGSAQPGHGHISKLEADVYRVRVTIAVLYPYAERDVAVQKYIKDLSTVLRDVDHMMYRQNYEKSRLMGSGSPALTHGSGNGQDPPGPFFHELAQHHKDYVVPTGNHPTGHPPSAVHSVQHPVSLGHPPTGPEHSSPLTSSRYYLNYNDYP